MRCWLVLLLAAAVAWGEEPAPATITATQGTGPTPGEVATDRSLSVDEAWSRARQQAQNEQRLRRAQAAAQTATAETTRGTLPAMTPTDPGGLASLVDGDEVTLLLELQRRRRNANREAGDVRGNVLTAELTSALAASPPRLPTIPLTPVEPGAVAHPGDQPHPGPIPPSPDSLPERPDHLPVR